MLILLKLLCKHRSTPSVLGEPRPRFARPTLLVLLLLHLLLLLRLVLHFLWQPRGKWYRRLTHCFGRIRWPPSCCA